ncbi:MAG: hypothetical protein U1F18_04760 [Steroidobacteraceae bacterium]
MNAEVPTPAPARRSLGGLLVKLLLVVILLGAGWTWFTLSWSYSDGDRGGVLQKFSRKGWVCKTYEGELAMYVVAGVAPQIWSFSARDPQVAADLSRYVGERVQLHYTEHVGIPTNCFGETRYFVDRVVLAPVNGATGGSTMPAPAPANPPPNAAPSPPSPATEAPPTTPSP